MSDIIELNNEELKEVSGGTNLISADNIRIDATYIERKCTEDAPLKYFARVKSVDKDKVAVDIGRTSIMKYDGKIILKYNQLSNYPLKFFLRDYKIEEEVLDLKWSYDVL